MEYQRCVWCGLRDENVTHGATGIMHETCGTEAGRRMGERLCCMCLRPLTDNNSNICGLDDCRITGYPPSM